MAQLQVSFRVSKELTAMVQLNFQLLFNANCLINDANVHRLKEMICAYEQAVDRHNRNWPGHEVYRIQSELKLRKYVLDRGYENLKKLTTNAIDKAGRAAARTIALVDKYDRLERKLTEWSHRAMTREKGRAA